VPLSTETHVRRFVNIADPDEEVVDQVRVALRSTARTRASWPTLKRLQEWTTAQRELLSIDSDDVLSNDDVLDLMASVRLVAIRAPAQFRRRPAGRFHRSIDGLLDSLEPDFVPELLKETRRRRDADPVFAAELAQSRRAVEGLVRRVSVLRAEVIESLPTEVADDPDRPVTLREESEGEVLISVVMIIFGIMLVWHFIASNDPSKESEDDNENGENGENPE
jgi:hypothetical protein